jgi:DNA polymerase
MEKKEKLLNLKKRLLENKKLPLLESNLVFGEGNSNASVVFIGEAPGFNEDKEGKPFVGRAGILLTKVIESINWKRKDIYITNIVKRRPPNNRDPESEEIEAYRPYLKEELKIINPKVIVPLGRFAMNYFLPDKKISQAQGKAFWLDDKIIFPIYHPAAGLRNGNFLENIEDAFIKLKKIVKNYNEILEKKIVDENNRRKNELL